jgi:hypothetical protein
MVAHFGVPMPAPSKGGGLHAFAGKATVHACRLARRPGAWRDGTGSSPRRGARAGDLAFGIGDGIGAFDGFQHSARNSGAGLRTARSCCRKSAAAPRGWTGRISNPSPARDRMTNWSGCTAALRKSETLLTWLDKHMSWLAPHDGSPGRPAFLADAAMMNRFATLETPEIVRTA